MGFREIGLIAAALLAISTAAEAAVVNISGTTNVSTDGSNAVVVNLGPGTYTLSPVIAAFTAFNRFGTVSGCNVGGAACTTGWDWGFEVDSNQPVALGSDFNCCGNETLYFSTAALAFDNAVSSLAAAGHFTVTTPTQLSFWISDNIARDNLGGISLNISAVPEPADWVLLLVGFGLLGSTMRLQRRRAPAATS